MRDLPAGPIYGHLTLASAPAPSPCQPDSHARDRPARAAWILPWESAMLRISVTTRPGGATVTLEGRLAGPWVDELARCWSSVTALRHASSVRVELDAVTLIDSAGKSVLRRMCEEGAVLFASGCMTRAILEEIETGQRERPRRRVAKRGSSSRSR